MRESRRRCRAFTAPFTFLSAALSKSLLKQSWLVLNVTITMSPELPMNGPSGNHKIWSILCHLSGFIGVGFILPLVVYFAMRDESDYVGSNARNALNFHLSILIYSICCIPLIFIVIGIPLLVAIGLVSLILSIIGAVKASEGRSYHYPLCIPFFSSRGRLR